MNWFSLTLEPGVDGLIEDAWKLAWEVARSSNALDYSNAIFQKPGPGKFEVTIYFSPSARLLAASFGAKRCDKPSASGMSLVAGDERAWDIHFGGRPAGSPLQRRVVGPPPVRFDPTEEPMHFEPTHPSGTFEPTHPAPLQ